MRLTTIFLFAGALHLAAAGRAQSVSLSVKDAALEDCFRSIQEQTGYSFIYTRNLLGDSRKVTLSLHGETLATALDRLFQNQPLTYTLVDKYIVVKRRPAVGLPPPAGAVSPPNDIRGRVVDSTGAPIAGASVLVKGTQRGAATDAKGEFVIKGVEGGVTLVVTYTGFEPRQYKYSGQAGVTILLERSTSPLDQIQVIAYGTTTQRFSTGNISTVKAADIEKQPVNNPLLALEGRVPGLFITQSNGLPGAGVTVRVEGQNSIASGNDPLYVIDGVPYVSQLLSTTEGGGTAGVLGSSGATGLGGNPLSYINSADIESIEVLKDADATAIYGSRAANGAILITTKKGKAGRTEVSLNAQTGWGKVTRHVKLLNTTQYLEMRHEAKRNDNTAILSTDYDMNGLWDTTRNTDWQKALIGGTAKYTQTNASVSGGTALAQYFLGGTYYRETAVFPGNFSDQKASLHFSESSASVNNKFHLQFSGNYMLDDNALPGADLTNVALQLAPDAPALYNTDGSLNWAPNAAGTSTWTNPLATLFNQYTNKTRNLISNLSLAYSILRGLDLKCSLGYTDLHTDETVLYPLTTLAPESRPNSTRSTIFTASNIGSWIAEPQAVYRTNIAHGKLEFLSGLTIQQNDNNGQWLQAKGFTSDDVMKDIKSAAAVTVNSTVVSAYKYEALFGRLNYNWQEKFIFDFNIRRDGSSRFGHENQFHNFGSVAGAWIFSKEDFVARRWRWLSFGKLRASYGTTGNDQIGDYQFLNLYTATNVGIPFQGTTGLVVNGLPNPYLEWEETKKLQFGLELGLLNNRLIFTADLVHNQSSNQLLQYSLPSYVGFFSIISNFPATVENDEAEFDLRIKNIQTGSFSWTSDLNVTFLRNKLVAFPNLQSSTYSSKLAIGQPISVIRAYRFSGVDPATGQYQFLDSHGHATFNPNFSTDRTAFVNSMPKFYGGFENTFTYRGFEVDFLLQFVKQTGTNYLFGSNLQPGYAKFNQPVTVLRRWQKSGDVTNIQRYSAGLSYLTGYSDAKVSDAGYSDASYIRMKNLSISYQFSNKAIQKMHIQGLRIYVEGQNLLTFTRFQGLDPENQSTRSLPVLRVLTTGIRLNL